MPAPTSAVSSADGDVNFTVARMRIDETDDQCLISGADDEEEPAGYFILELDGSGATVEVLGEELSQRDGVQALEIGPYHLAFTFDPASRIGRQMPRLRITSVEAIGTVVAVRLAAVFGMRLTQGR